MSMSIKEHPPRSSDLAAEAKPRLHVPVLLDAMVNAMNPVKGETYLDLTAGYGGHASAFLAHTLNYQQSVLVDRDSNAIAKLGNLADKGIELRHTDFVTAAKQLVHEGRRFSLICVDLGVSSPQLDRSERGFSFTSEGPLDMRMDDREQRTAAEIVNRSSRQALVGIITKYGEERRGSAQRIANAIVAKRPFRTTKELAECILSTHRGKWQKTHPATRTFQALRIAVNDELGQVEALLPLLPKLLEDNGRVGIISFHSLEDRLVKQYFKEQNDAGYESELQVLTKKPIRGDTDDVHNPRSRSAKLRIAVKK